jgi:multidrug resistance efflux pump
MSETRREIKVPPARRFREFRMRFMPIAIFAAAVVAAGYLWNQAVLGPTMVGEVEGIQAVVKAPDAGVVTNLLVRPYEVVKKGQPLAQLISGDLRTISPQIQEARSRLSAAQLELDAILDYDRLGYHYQSMAMDTIRFRADLATAEAQLPIAESAFERAERGWKEQVVPYNDYEQARRERDSLRARIGDMRMLVKEAELHLTAAGKNVAGYTNQQSTLLIKDAVDRLRNTRAEVDKTRIEPFILRAPIDGVVGTIFHRDGENVQAGDTVMTIHALEGTRIIAYMRQGMTEMPKRNSPIKVRCRSHGREEAMATIEDVGFRYEPITNHALMRPGVSFEVGMPVGISIPESLRPILKPGEIVDLAVGQ